MLPGVELKHMDAEYHSEDEIEAINVEGKIRYIVTIFTGG